MGRWPCALEPQFGPLGGSRTVVQLKKLNKNSVSRLGVDWIYEDKEVLGVSSKDKQYKTQSTQSVCVGGVLPCSIISVLALDRERTSLHDFYCHGNQVGHSSEWGWSRMNVSHILQAFTQEKAFVTTTTTQRHVHIHIQLNNSGAIASESSRMSRKFSVKASKEYQKQRRHWKYCLPQNVSPAPSQRKGVWKASRLWDPSVKLFRQVFATQPLTAAVVAHSQVRGEWVRHFWHLDR